MMRNPLRKRYLRELKSDFGKYLVIFLFMIMLISLVSGFLIVDNSFHQTYLEGFEKYNIEDGHITFDKKPDQTVLEQIKEQGDLEFYELFYFEEELDNSEATIRIYEDRDIVNTECIMSGRNPQKENEIALDRMFASNNSINIGDTIACGENEYEVVGLVAFPDYSCLFKKNTDMMFDAINFGVACVTKESFSNNSGKVYNYAWKYNNAPIDENQEDEYSQKLLDILEDVIKEYDIEILQVQIDALYDKADLLKEELEKDFEVLGDEIENKMTTASEKAVDNLIKNTDQMTLYLLSTQGYKDEELVREVAKQNNTTLNALAAKELGTNEKTMQDMLDAIEEIEDLTKEDNFSYNERIDLHNFDNTNDYENDMEFSFEDINSVLDKIDAVGVFNTTAVRQDITQLEALTNFELDESQVLDVDDYVARYQNNAINFTGDDMGKDGVMFTVFGYIVIVILAFVFAVTISNTISQEAGTIGTLRASGYTRAEMIRHYLVLPVGVTITAAAIGNILGYTVFKQSFIDMYYESYSLAIYEDRWNQSAFIKTTIVPVILMLVINFLVLAVKMKLTPLQFIKKQLSNKQKKKAIHLSRKLPFMHRFRMRILFQNLPAYITLFIGIFVGAVIVVFGNMFGPLLKDYSKLIVESKIADYQYVLMEEVETTTAGVERYNLENLDFAKEGYITDEVSIYGIEQNSKYILADIPEGKVLVSNGLMDKYGLQVGDEFTLNKHFGSDTYSFVIAGEYKYDAGLAVFMNNEDFIRKFNKKEESFAGYFTNELITDIEEDKIATIITASDLSKFADQLEHSMGSFISYFKIFGMIMFILLMYLMTKQIIEKNMVSISMTKILGFKPSEIGGLYLVMTSFVVLASLFISIPIVDATLRVIFHKYIYVMMSGYIPFIISPNCYISMLCIGIVSYLFVCIFMMIKINKIPKSEALKNVE